MRWGGGIKGSLGQKPYLYHQRGYIKQLSQLYVISQRTIVGLPPLYFVHGSHMCHKDIIDHVAAAPGSLVCPSRGAPSRNCLNQT